MSKSEIRRARKGDEKIFAYIQTESWKQAFKDIISEEMMSKCADIARAEAMYKSLIGNPKLNLYLQSVDDEPHCICAWSEDRESQSADIAELICIHSLPKNRRCGFGSAMMKHALSDIKSAGYSQVVLWCFEENTVARSFYEKIGFVCTNRVKDGFGSTEVMYALSEF